MLFHTSTFFLKRQIWITDGPLEYHRDTSGTTRSYPSPLGIMPTHQFRSKLNKYGKKLLVVIELRTYYFQSLITPQNATRLYGKTQFKRTF
ncbi:hypothetical protein Hanom_Chr14g01262251 [Helianthus anomalus]